MDFRTLSYAFLLFFFNMFSVSSDKFIFDFSSMSFNSESLIECVITTVLLLLFSVIYATIIRKIETAKHTEFAFFALLLIADPLFRSIRFNLASLITQIITMLLCIYLYVGKSLNLKSVFVATYTVALSLFCSELICGYTSIVILVFCVSLFDYEKDVSVQIYKRKSKKTNNKTKQIKIEEKNKSLFIALLLSLLIFLSMILNKYFTETSLLSNIMFSLDNGIYFSYKDMSLWFAVIPYIALLLAFVIKYFYIKNNNKKFSLSSCFRESKYLILIVFVFIATLVGIFVFDNGSNITLFNTIIIITIMLIAKYDPANYSEVINWLSGIYQKHKFSLWMLFIMWFVFVHYQFRYVLYPDLKDIVRYVGGRL